MHENREKINISHFKGQLSGAKILLAEDNPLNQQIVEIALAKVEADVTVAENGIQCLKMLEKKKFGAVLMDLQMPVMDGYEATLNIRESFTIESLPIIAMTANAASEERKKCLDAGMNDYITKPFVMDDLYVVLSKWIKKNE